MSPYFTLTPLGGTASAAGNNTLLTPPSNQYIRLFYMAYNPKGAVEAGFRFGATGNIFLQGDVPANTYISKEMGLDRALEGARDVPLILNLSAAVATNWTVFYEYVR